MENSRNGALFETHVALLLSLPRKGHGGGCVLLCRGDPAVGSGLRSPVECWAIRGSHPADRDPGDGRVNNGPAALPCPPHAWSSPSLPYPTQSRKTALPIPQEIKWNLGKDKSPL